MKNEFLWCKHDCKAYIPKNWLNMDDLINLATYKEIIPFEDSTSRESPDIQSIPTYVLDGNKIRLYYPWIFKLYEGVFLKLAKNAFQRKYTLQKVIFMRLI